MSDHPENTNEDQIEAEEKAFEGLLAEALLQVRCAIASGVEAELDQFAMALPTEEKTKRILDKIQFLEACATNDPQHDCVSIDGSLSFAGEFCTLKNYPNDLPPVEPSTGNQRSKSRRYDFNKPLFITVLLASLVLLILFPAVHCVQRQRLAQHFWHEFENAEESQDLGGMYWALYGYVQCAEDSNAHVRLNILEQEIKLFVDANPLSKIPSVAIDKGGVLRRSDVNVLNIPEPPSISIAVGMIIFVVAWSWIRKRSTRKLISLFYRKRPKRPDVTDAKSGCGTPRYSFG